MSSEQRLASAACPALGAGHGCSLTQLATVVAAYEQRMKRGRKPSLVSVGGSVAAGKSTLAKALAGELRGRGHRVEVVSTDGFLRADEELAQSGELQHKGQPHTHDQARIAAFFADLQRGDDLRVPRYCHGRRAVTHVDPVAAPELVILEGVVALDAVARHRAQAVCTVYVEAPLALLERWYVERFRRLRAREGELDVEQQALAVWRAVNLPNLRQHIAAWRVRSDVVVYKGADHEITRMLLRTPAAAQPFA